MKNAISWIEIPVTDFDRAKEFYGVIYGQTIEEMPFPMGKYGVLPHNEGEHGCGGGIVQMEGMKPGVDGPTVYLNGGEDLSGPLAKVEGAGGKIIMPKTEIGENGFMAQFIDTEGNRLALHSPK